MLLGRPPKRVIGAGHKKESTDSGEGAQLWEGCEGRAPKQSSHIATTGGKGIWGVQDDSQTREHQGCLDVGATPEMGTWEEEQVGETCMGSGHSVKAEMMDLLGQGLKGSVQDNPRCPWGQILR